MGLHPSSSLHPLIMNAKQIPHHILASVTENYESTEHGGEEGGQGQRFAEESSHQPWGLPWTKTSGNGGGWGPRVDWALGEREVDDM